MFWAGHINATIIWVTILRCIIFLRFESPSTLFVLTLQWARGGQVQWICFSCLQGLETLVTLSGYIPFYPLKDQNVNPKQRIIIAKYIFHMVKSQKKVEDTVLCAPTRNTANRAPSWVLRWLAIFPLLRPPLSANHMCGELICRQNKCNIHIVQYK